MTEIRRVSHIKDINMCIPVGAAVAAVPVSGQDHGEVAHGCQKSPDIFKKPRIITIWPVNGADYKLKITTFFLQAEKENVLSFATFLFLVELK
jgi:hypothetical protein